MAAHPRLAPALGPPFGPGVTGAATSTEAAGVSRRFVVVDGAGPLASSVATLLRAAGVGLVRAGAWAADTADAELRLGGSAGPDLLVLNDADWTALIAAVKDLKIIKDPKPVAEYYTNEYLPK